MHYVIGDIHGCYTAWIRLKNRIERRDPDAKFILVGDIVDRGPQVTKMLRWAVENISLSGKYQMILGNHEAEKISWIKKLLEGLPEHEYENRLKQMDPDNYDFKYHILNDNVSFNELNRILELFEHLPLYKEMDITCDDGRTINYIIVHGGISESLLDYDCRIKKDMLDLYFNYYEGLYPRLMKGRDIILWSRNTVGYPSLNDTVIISGHTPTVSSRMIDAGAEPGKVYFSHNSINVDCGMVFYFQDKALFQYAPKANLASYCLENGSVEYAYKH